MASRPIESLAEALPEETIATVAENRQKADLVLLKNPVWVKIGELLNENNPDKAKGFMDALNEIKSNDDDAKKTEYLLRILEKYSDHTASHSGDMRNIFENLESLKNLPGMEILRNTDMPSLAAAIERHDIGKIAMPDRILNTPNIRYTPEDIRIKETHSLAGHLILRALKFDEKSVRLALTHHLRYKTLPDGSVTLAGYPVKDFLEYCEETNQKPELTAEDQLAAFADVFFALTDPNRMTDLYETHGKKLDTVLEKMNGIFSDYYYQKGDGSPLYSAFKKAMWEMANQKLARAA